MNKIALSVVIPVYNGETFLRDCLASVLAEANDLSSEIGLSEIVCVDDASSDRSVEIISADFASVTLVCNNYNRGFAYTCNLGMRESRGEFIFLLNQDTRLKKGALKSLYGRLQLDQKIAFVGPRFVGFDGELQRKCASFPTFGNVFWKMVGMSRIFPESKRFANLGMGWFDHLSEFRVDQPMGAALMFRRDILNKVGYLDESFPIYFN
ncbi:MAG: glycosyltransferase, partial [candidate division Zixibacteria bacterium]|nr:glycosyltransferase [candidate division Zixibacteria bacterium]